MPEGVLLLDRQYFSKPEWLNQASAGGFTRAAAWLDLLSLTNQTATQATVRGILIPLERGECAYSKLGLSIRWGRSQSWVAATQAMWVKDGRILIRKSDNETTVIFVTNFDAWQTGLLDQLLPVSRADREQNENKPRADREQFETEKEKEKDTDTEPRREGEGEEGGGRHLPELPSDSALIEFGAQFAGETTTGTPGPMAAAWVIGFIKRINGRREFPRNWKRLMVSSWRDEWRTAATESPTLQKKPGAPVSASVTAIDLGQQIAALEQEIEQDRQTNQPRDSQKTARLRSLRAQLQQLKG